MVLPQLTPDGLAETAGAPPPRSFKPIVGKPTHVRWLNAKIFGGASAGRTSAQQNGLRYEAKVQDHLKKRFPVDYHIQASLSFRDDTGPRIVVPDGVLLRRRDAVIFEIKSQHMPEAWWQLSRLYKPVLEEFWKGPITCCEVVRSFDPSIGFPEPIKLCHSIDDVLDESPVDFKVLLWRL